ncbi:hypothetical protein M3Y99_01653900 [Aphelenchoides fujianensis]|nr:hypothetical protein M3Y99_01653900 [Aphelenchoides fujianensis]
MSELAALDDSAPAKPCTPKDRFVTCLFVLASMGGVCVGIQALVGWRLLSGLMAAAVGGFGYQVGAQGECPTDRSFQWTLIHSPGLTRKKHAFFDEANIIKTYQPRARTMGHLFQPDPPTPVPTDPKAAEDDGLMPKQTKSEFEMMRDAHYAHEFTHIQRVGKELSGEATGPTVKIEDPISVEFKEPPEDDDDEDV